jgi:sterol desaturase/sphingolipid hydroxylase (fatty acid hydroxylase superfamily)
MSIKNTQIIILTVVFLLQYFFEHIYPQRREINDWKNERFNIGIGLLNVLVTFIPAALLVQWIAYIDLNKFGILHLIMPPKWLQFLFSILILDAWMYAWHRLNHQLPFLWGFHIFHHKDEKLNTTTALRFHVVELLLSYPGKAMVCFLFGISYMPLLVYEILFFIAVIIHHSNMYITEAADKIYRILFSSPLMHRIHHSKNWDETNSNFGALFSFWDLLFKSRKNKPRGIIEFGIFSSHKNKYK